MQSSLLQVVAIKVGVTEGMDKITQSQSSCFRHHQNQQGIGCDVKGNTEKNISATLVELAGQFSIGHIKLKKGMAGRQSHLIDFTYIPGADNHST